MALRQVEAYLNRGENVLLSTRVYLKPDQWDVKRRMVKNHPNSDALNRMLYDFIE
ncbi:Arm DNA-binding domain-containing protein [Bacteroides thetaiotaomicron]|uniref:Arm DNA-binding domain-containing protein n=1 Tax=Bacteroides thetaiotaomicron TaxID=818 RepID=UPI0035B3E79F